jgi:type I restriction enzyme, S subunit
MDTQTFLKNFGAIAQAPDGIDRLRELIVGLAMCGRLLPQNPADGGGAELLQLAEREREELVSLGVVKRATTVPPVDADDVPFELPKAWEWARLDRCALYNNRAKVKPQEISDDSWVLDLEDIEKRSSTLLQRVKHVERKSKATKTSFRAGDVLYGKLRPYLDKVIVADSSGYCTTEIVPVTPLGGIDPYWLRWCMKRPDFVQLVEDLSYGVKMPRLGTDDAKESLHPIPPLAEQHRIVAKVDELMALCDELETQQQTRQQTTTRFRSSALDSLVNAESDDELSTAWNRVQENWSVIADISAGVSQLRRLVLALGVTGVLSRQDSADEPAALLLEQLAVRKGELLTLTGRRTQAPIQPIHAADRPYSLPEGWVWARIDDCFLVTGGIQKSSRRRPLGNSFPYLRVANVQRGRLDLAEISRFELFAGELESYRLEDGDLLVVEGNGSESEIGRSARWNGEISDCVHQNHLIRCRPLGSGIEEFAMRFLNSPVGMSTMRELAVTTSGLFNLSVGKIRAIPMPVPPAAEQARIVAKVDELMGLCDRLEASLEDRETVSARLSGSVTSGLVT